MIYWLWAIVLRIVAAFRDGEAGGPADFAWIDAYVRSRGMTPEHRWYEIANQFGEVIERQPYFTAKGEGRHMRVAMNGFSCQIDYGETHDFSIHLPPRGKQPWWRGVATRFTLSEVGAICDYVLGGERPR